MSLCGLIAALRLPVEEYPEIAPATVRVSASYPGASAQVVADAMATPIEDQINGVENMAYYSSTCDNSGSYSCSVAFISGADSDMALVNLQNAVKRAEAKLPAVVRQRGVMVQKRNSDMLAMFYVAMPPFSVSGGQHHFLYIDMGVIEACALVLVAACPGPGLWTAIKVAWRRLRPAAPAPEGGRDVISPDRRDMIAGLASIPALGGFAGAFVAKHGIDVFGRKKGNAETVTSASYRFKYQDIGDIKKKFDQFVQIGDFKMSRITLGGNPIGGWAHSRDLGYVSTLMKAYNTEKRIFDTMHLAEACGVNTISTNPSLMNFIKKYWREDGGTINFVSDCGHKDENGELGIVVGAKKSVDAGAKLIYIHGFGADKWAVEGNWKVMEKALKEMRKLGVPVGIGAHAFSTLKFCVEHDLIPDFWMKTFHPGGYWSAQKTPQDGGEGEPGSSSKGWRDNNWCRDPKALSEWFENRPEPWIAFKIMAAGAVHPRQAIPFVFNGGADAACMGMFDFQVVEDVNLAVDAFAKGFPDRRRKWC